MRAQDVRDSLGKQGFDVVASSPSEFASWIRVRAGEMVEGDQGERRSLLIDDQK